MSNTLHIYEDAAAGREDRPRIRPQAETSYLRLCRSEEGARQRRLTLLPSIEDLAALVRGPAQVPIQRSLPRRMAQALITGRSAGGRARSSRVGL